MVSVGVAAPKMAASMIGARSITIAIACRTSGLSNGSFGAHSQPM